MQVDTDSLTVLVPGHLWFAGRRTPHAAQVVRAAAADWDGVTDAQLLSAKKALLGRPPGPNGEWPPGFVEGFRGTTYDDYVYIQNPVLRYGITEFVIGLFNPNDAAYDYMHLWYARLPPQHCRIITHGMAPTSRLLRDMITAHVLLEQIQHHAIRLPRGPGLPEVCCRSGGPTGETRGGNVMPRPPGPA